MTHLQAAIEANRSKLRAAQRCGDRDMAQLFAGIVVGQRIILGEVKVTLRPRILSTADEADHRNPLRHHQLLRTMTGKTALPLQRWRIGWAGHGPAAPAQPVRPKPWCHNVTPRRDRGAARAPDG
jgi:hypothetical protein